MSYYPPQVQVSYAPPPASTAHIIIAWIVAVFTGLYMLPWAIAATRSKQNVVSVVMINLFLGWTVIGWIVALVMACSAHPMPATVLVNNATQVSYGQPALGWSPAYPAQQYPEWQQTYGSVQQQPPRYQHPDQPYYPQPFGASPYETGYEPTRSLPAPQPSATELTQPLPPWSRAADPYGQRPQ
jgi:hypothetical protein